SQIPDLKPAAAVRALLDHAFWTWACLGPGAGVSIAARARELSRGAPRPLQASADVAWSLCAYGAGDPRGPVAALRAARRADFAVVPPAGADHWALEPAGVAGDLAVWSEQIRRGGAPVRRAALLGRTAKRSVCDLPRHFLLDRRALPPRSVGGGTGTLR